jgi:sugar phosphate isomerase/epimerase
MEKGLVETMTIPIGATSYVFRYLLSDPLRAPRIDELIRLAKNAGLDSFQICENARPLSVSPAEWTLLARNAADLGLELSLGCMTLSPGTIVEYLNRVQAIGGSYLRVVLEREGEPALTMDRIRQFLDGIVPELESRKIRLAIENHFEIPSRLLAEAVETFPTELIGFCVDVANSLRNFEDTNSVLDLLSPRAVCYHLKDYLVQGSNVGFAVSGAPFGEGRIDTHSLLRHIFGDGDPAPRVFLETWTPATGIWATDVAEDTRWLAASIQKLNILLADFRTQFQMRI